jgi:LPXTG-motif cell wall-anchored protein
LNTRKKSPLIDAAILNFLCKAMIQRPIDGFYNLLPLVQRRAPIDGRDWLRETPNHLAQAQIAPAQTISTSTENQVLPKTEDNTALFIGGGLAILAVAALAAYRLRKSGQLRHLLNHFLRQGTHRDNRTQEAKAIDRYQAEFVLKKNIPKPQSESPLANPPTVTNQTNEIDNSDSLIEPLPQTTRDRYLVFVEQVITDINNGKLLSKEHVYNVLSDRLEPGTGEIFERVLEEQANVLQANFSAQTDEVKQAKANHKIRALKNLKDAWEQWQKNYQVQDTCARGLQKILNTEASERLSTLIQILDPNNTPVFERQHIQLLAQSLPKSAETINDESEAFELRQFAMGLTRGLASFDLLEGSLISWLYKPTQVGFESVKIFGPWHNWSQQVTSPLPREIFAGQASNQSAAAIAQGQRSIDISAWVELSILLQYLQKSLVRWFDQQPYNLKAGHYLAGTTFVEFALIWCELSNGFQRSQHLSERDRQYLSKVCFRITLQILRTFAQRENFPLYGGVYASFAGESFRETINYLDQPLKESENTQEKARILTVLGYSQAWMGNYDQAIALHQEAVSLAREVGDQRCEIANLNHLSRISLYQKDFSMSASQAQRAVILARQNGDRQGEANALANLGYSEVMILRQQESVKPEDIEIPIIHLEQGQKLSEKLNDVQNQALCWVGLGTAYVTIEQPSQAQLALEKGLALTQQIGDRDLQALSYFYLGEAFYQLEQLESAIYHACLGMYFLEQRHSKAWQQSAALVVILQGKLGVENFFNLLQQQRSQLIAQIGVDGFEYLPSLIDRYRQS